MTTLLDEAIEKVRALPPAEQDHAAEMLLALAAKREEPEELDEETIAAIEEGMAQADRGEFATDEEIEALFARHRK